MNHSDALHDDERRTSPDPRQLSALLLRLYAATDGGDVPSFQDHAIGILNDVVAFNGSWWGSGAGTSSGHKVHGSHLRNLPADLPQMLNASGAENPMARLSAQNPNKAFLFTAATLHSTAAVAALSAHMSAKETLCITQTDHAPHGPLRFLVITRGANDPPFLPIDLAWLELLNPHLTAALDLCCRAEMARWRRVHDTASLLAISDAKGFLYLSEPGLPALLLEEWPDWAGERLPDDVISVVTTGLAAFLGKTIHIEVRRLGERILLSLRRRHPFDALSPQERAISIAFASGESYKLVARHAGIAPTTVRHHLRSAYAKLGVSDKAALARLAPSLLPVADR